MLLSRKHSGILPQMAKKNRIESPEEKQYRENVEAIAKNIGVLARAVGQLLDGPLNKKALVILLAQSSGQSQKAVTEVLDALQSLEKDWLK
jgi:hypothetical protein